MRWPSAPPRNLTPNSRARPGACALSESAGYPNTKLPSPNSTSNSMKTNANRLHASAGSRVASASRTQTPNGGPQARDLLARHGLSTRAKRFALIAGYAAPYEPPHDPVPEQHTDVDHRGELVGIDCFYVGRLKGTDGTIWQLTAIAIASSFAWAELVICKQGNPTSDQVSKLAKRVAKALKAAGWQLERVLSDNGNEFRGLAFACTLEKLKVKHTRIHAGPTDQRQRRSAPQNDPRRVLATSVRTHPHRALRSRAPGPRSACRPARMVTNEAGALRF